jgi:hypothetical protein
LDKQLERHLIDYAVDQYRVSGEWYVIRCLRMWADEYGKDMAESVKRAVERKLGVEIS